MAFNGLIWVRFPSAGIRSMKPDENGATRVVRSLQSRASGVEMARRLALGEFFTHADAIDSILSDIVSCLHLNHASKWLYTSFYCENIISRALSTVIYERSMISQ